MTWPVCCADELRLGAPQRADAELAATLAVSTRCAPLVSSSTGCAVGVEEQAVGDRADLAAERLGGELRRCAPSRGARRSGRCRRARSSSARKRVMAACSASLWGCSLMAAT